MHFVRIKDSMNHFKVVELKEEKQAIRVNVPLFISLHLSVICSTGKLSFTSEISVY